jgi:hypothetical protein
MVGLEGMVELQGMVEAFLELLLDKRRIQDRNYQYQYCSLMEDPS